jgi:hypothetical protein
MSYFTLELSHFKTIFIDSPATTVFYVIQTSVVDKEEPKPSTPPIDTSIF